jgi:hypothetical protein
LQDILVSGGENEPWLICPQIIESCLYVVFSSTPPRKKQRGTRGGKGRGQVQNVAVEKMENTQGEEEDIVKDLQLSDLE